MRKEIVQSHLEMISETVSEVTEDPLDVIDICEAVIGYAKSLKKLAEGEIKRNVRYEGRDAD